MYSGIYEVHEFKYASWIFQGAKRVAMATKFGEKLNQNCTDFSYVQEILLIFRTNSKIFEVSKFKYAI